MARTLLALLVTTAGCGLIPYDHDHDAERPPTAAELQAEIDLLAAASANLAAATDQMVQQVLHQPGQGVSLFYTGDVPCPAGGALRTTGNLSALCPETPGRCNAKSFAEINTDTPVVKPPACLYPRGIRVGSAVQFTLVGDDVAYTVALNGVLSVESLGSDGPAGHVYGCVFDLSGAVPGRTFTGRYCSAAVNQTL